jgi:hypothetical protein
MDNERMMLVSPAGTMITGTFERLGGQAKIVAGSARKNALGGIEFDYEGTMEIFWDQQRTVKHEDERVFLDDEGDYFIESELRLMPAEGGGRRRSSDFESAGSVRCR